MTNTTYIRYEVIRSFRSWRFVAFSLAYPLVLYFAIAEPNRHHSFDGVSFPLYFMTGMAAIGTMIAVVSSGARISTERSVGWTRQMRITPLRTSSYFGAKVLSGYLMGMLAIGLLFASGTTLGVSLPATRWATLAGLLLVGLVPFVLLGILLGHVLSTDSVTPAAGGVIVLFGVLGGAYAFEVAKSGPMFEIMKALPSYWLVQAGKAAAGGGGWPVEGWVVIAAWTAVLLLAALLAYRRDTRRV